jgi:hypothetical protein
MTARIATRAAGLLLIPAVILAAAPVRTADPVGVYGMIERLQFEPAGGDPDRIQVWGVFAFADDAAHDGYGAVQRGYMYYACPADKRAVCRNDWEDFRWFSGTGKGVGYGLRSAPVGRLRKSTEPPASPDPYPVRGGIVKVESKDPAYVDLVARLKAALK